jgi:L-cysteine S-thiosulfotransferase
MKAIRMAVAVAAILAAGIAGAADNQYAKQAAALIKSDFQSKGPATVERVSNQDEAQQLCSSPVPPSKSKARALEASQLKQVRYPADGNYLGDWKAGEKIAQSGKGMQSSDKADAVNGGNCYACHQVSKEEISFGNIGPSLYHYGKTRGNSEATLKYTWAKLYNSQAFQACSKMPRFGHNGILTEQQIKDVMALLLDPNSPVNK